jgi:DNA uptake protein ComE-like DNA-binding protein
MKRTLLCTLLLVGSTFLVAGCQREQTPDQIRHETAQATREVARDTKAVAQGIADGIRAKSPESSININHASDSDLESLSGIDAHTAHRIIAARPYDDAHDLVKRHLISQAEYDRISGKITAN